MSDRKELHRRQLDMRFYERTDGLFEVEGSLHDSKSQPFRIWRATEDTKPGDPIHDIVVTLVVDDTLVIKDARAQMRTAPFARCSGVADTLAPLRGLAMAAGWNRQVREKLGGAACCTHVVEMLAQLATTAYQGLASRRLAQAGGRGTDNHGRAKVDSCYAFAAEGEVVREMWPHLHRK